MTQEIFSWKKLPVEEVGDRTVAEITVNGTAPLGLETNQAMVKIQREILASFPDEDVHLLINLHGLVIGEIGELFTNVFIRELAELSKEWANLVVYSDSSNRALIATALAYGTFSSTKVTGRTSREDALKKITQPSKK